MLAVFAIVLMLSLEKKMKWFGEQYGFLNCTLHYPSLLYTTLPYTTLHYTTHPPTPTHNDHDHACVYDDDDDSVV